MLKPFKPSAVQQTDSIAAVCFGLNHIPARGRYGRNYKIAFTGAVVDILGLEFPCQPRVHQCPPNIIKRDASIQSNK
ncbi:hypothetical protein D3C75_994900 [compost metagenome]